jgi:hypothetical protein
LFGNIFESDVLYRTTGVTLYGLAPADTTQVNLFAQDDRGEVFGTIDKLNRKYGRSVIHIASSTRALIREEGRGFQRKLCIPCLGRVI